MTSLAVIVLLLILNAFFVAAEFALVKAQGMRIGSFPAARSSAATMVVRIQANLESYLAACQLGISMASLGLGWVGAPAVAALLKPLFHFAGTSESVTQTVSFLLGFLFFSSMHYVVGERVPKAFAIRRPETVSLIAAYPLRLAYLLVWPLNWCLSRVSAAILSWFNFEDTRHREVLAEEEEPGCTSQGHGEIERQKTELLSKLFEFDQRSIQRVMIPRRLVSALDIAVPSETNRQVVLSSGHSSFPLIDGAKDGQIIGVVLVKSILFAVSQSPSDSVDPWTQLEKYSRPGLVVPEDQKTAALFEIMREQRNPLAVVMDEYGKLSGIVTLGDLLEEMVGDGEDKTDIPSPDG